MTWHHMIAHEWRTRLSQPAVLVSLALFLLCLVYAAASGRAHMDSRLDAAMKHEAEIATQRLRWLSDLKLLEEEGERAGVPAWSGSAMDVSFSSYLPAAPLADFAIGQSDLMPHLGAISLWDPDLRLFSRYEFADPMSLGLGGFDLSKAIILVLPLVLIAVCFDVLSADRDANRLTLLLAQGVGIRELSWRRLSIRAGIILALTLSACFAAFAWPFEASRMSERLPFFTLWVVACVLYAAFWIAVIAVVASGNRTGETNIVMLLLTWAVLTLILPASVVAVSEAIYPAPSRVAYLAEAREAEIETELAQADLSSRTIVDHPEMLGATASIPEYVRTAFLVTAAVDEATRPVLSAFETSAQRREGALSLLRVLSPAMSTHGIFSDIAGTSSARHRDYMSQARALKAAYATRVAPQVLAGRRLSVREARSLPEFRFEEALLSSVARRSASVLVFLAVGTIALLVVADRRLRSLGAVCFSLHSHT